MCESYKIAKKPANIEVAFQKCINISKIIKMVWNKFRLQE